MAVIYSPHFGLLWNFLHVNIVLTQEIINVHDREVVPFVLI